MLGYLEYLKLPAAVAGAIVVILLVANLVGELLELKGKVVPEFMKIRKYFKRKREEKREQAETLKEVKKLLADVNGHYSADNISKRDAWMGWVNSRAEVYDNSIIEIKDKLALVTAALQDNSKLTEELFVQSSRDRIIDFGILVADGEKIVSREQFHRIFKVHEDYEKFLKKRGLTNGETDIAMRVINESYATHMREHTFLEDVRGYNY
jgi:hypothetical protein